MTIYTIWLLTYIYDYIYYMVIDLYIYDYMKYGYWLYIDIYIYRLMVTIWIVSGLNMDVDSIYG